MRESELKLAVEQYLQYQENMGNLVFSRRNAGNAFVGEGEYRRRIKLGKPGESDFHIECRGRSIYLELKGERGKLSDAQEDFRRKVEGQGASYYAIWDFDPNDQDDLLMRALWG